MTEGGAEAEEQHPGGTAAGALKHGGVARLVPGVTGLCWLGEGQRPAAAAVGAAPDPARRGEESVGRAAEARRLCPRRRAGDRLPAPPAVGGQQQLAAGHRSGHAAVDPDIRPAGHGVTETRGREVNRTDNRARLLQGGPGRATIRRRQQVAHPDRPAVLGVDEVDLIERGRAVVLR
jgi:hypothetical protein